MKLSEAQSSVVVGADKNLLDTSAPKGNENNTEQIYQIFLQAAAGGVENKPVLMYQGINTSPYSGQIKDYPARLMQKPDGKNLISGTQLNAIFSPYPYWHLN
jgi:hypothetical protein